MTVFLFTLILISLLFCSALVSGSEVAFFSCSRNQIQECGSSRRKARKVAIGLLERPNKLLATILLANNFVNIGIVVVSTFLCENIFTNIQNELLLFVIEVVGVTSLILLFGEVVPKIYANKNRMSIILTMAIPLKYLQNTFHYFIKLLLFSAKALEGVLAKKNTVISVDEISRALDIASIDGTSKNEQKILKGIISFGNTEIKQVMKPRTDVMCIDIESNYTSVLNTVLKNGYSRMPVYRNNMDNVEGILYIKDLLPHLDETDDFKWQKLLREAFFVHENKKIDNLLKDFKGKRIHLAIVVDEYGGVLGIITLEDILEEVVGDIKNEFEDDDTIYSRLDEHRYIFDGKTLLVDFYKILNLNYDSQELFETHKSESDTLAGFMLELTGDFPSVQQQIKFYRYTFTIEMVNKKRIKRIKVHIGNE